ncbi:MAG: glycosyltransferase family 4 protein [Rhizobiales bacterium]|nr:glycosyltransferase family 4 protein [Hyphomicrobiales bacterium]
METYSKRLTEELARFTEVDVLALPGRKDGMTPGWLQLARFGLVTAFKLLVRNPARVTHLGDMAIWPLAVPAKLRSAKTRLVMSAHGTDVSYPLRGGVKGRLYGFYLRLGARLLPGVSVIANSRATRDAASTYGFKDIQVVNLATDVVDVKSGHKPGRHLLFAGRLIKLKGLAWFVEQVLPLLTDDITIRVAGTVWDADEGAALQHERVQFLGSLSQPDLRHEYAAALCVIIPNIAVPSGQFEGFGLIATEAAAAGGVALAADHGGLVDAVKDGVTGFHVASGNAEAWAKKIADVAAWSPKKRAGFIQAAIQATRQHYSWARVAKETFKSYGIDPSA